MESGIQLEAITRALRTPSRAFYAEADLATAKRLGGLLWLIGGAIVLILTPAAPPIESPLGRAGWALSAFVIAACFVSGRRLLRRPEEVTVNELYAASYLALAMICMLVWLGGDAYVSIYLLSCLYTAAVHPPRRVVPYLFALMFVLGAPLAYDGWNAEYASEVFGRLLIWVGLCVIVMVWISTIRAQRRGLRREGARERELARVDALTGLANRRAFDEALDASVARARRSESPLTLIVADLDGFKAINDHHGHVAGDDCLRQVAAAIRRTVRAPDACFRWGGDEFAIIADTDAMGAAILCDRVRASVIGDCVAPDGRPLDVCFGVSELVQEATATELVAAADRDLLSAKART